MDQRFYQVDAFPLEDKPFSGNPAAILVLKSPASPAWMQALAAQMNLSETAYLVPRETSATFDLRWFTPTEEVLLCGHATLASAHVLWELGLAPREEAIRFHTRSGELKASFTSGWIELDLPAWPAEPAPTAEPVLAALGVAPVWTGLHAPSENVLIEVESEQAVVNARPNFSVMRAERHPAIILTARSRDERYDFVSRYFAPAYGIDEDPVTGSAHCVLAPFWCARLNRESLSGFQASARGGLVRVRYSGGDRVTLQGRAKTMAEGRLSAHALERILP